MRHWLLRDLGTKLLALFLGALLWFYARGEVVDTQTIPVKLDIKTEEDVIVTVPGGTTTIELEVQGKKSDIERLQQAQLSVVVFAQLDAGEDDASPTVTLSEKNVTGMGGNVNIISFKPPKITLKLSRKGQQPKQVEVQIQGSPPPGYEVGDILVLPSTVTVEGPKTLLATVDTVRTGPVYVPPNQRTWFGTRQVAIDPHVEGGEITCKETVQVYVEVRLVRAKVTIEGIPVRIQYAAGFKYQVKLKDPETATIAVDLVGPEGKLDEINKDPGNLDLIVAFVDVTGLGLSEVAQKRTVRFVLPPGVSLAKDPDGKERRFELEVMVTEPSPEPETS